MTYDHVYDKAKYHDETCQEYGLSEEHACVHTGLYFAWLVLNGFVNPELELEAHVIDDLKSRKSSPISAYEWCDTVLVDGFLTDEGNAFSMAYFEFETGQYLKDYEIYVAFDVATLFHVPNTWASYDRIAPVLDIRLQQFRGENVLLPKPSAPRKKTFWEKFSGR